MSSKINYWKEFILTFSNKKSLLSSKKIERFIAFNTFLIITIIYLNKHMEHLTPENLIEIIGVWLTYGGYNSFMNYRDKKIGDAPVDDLVNTEVQDAVKDPVSVEKPEVPADEPVNTEEPVENASNEISDESIEDDIKK